MPQIHRPQSLCELCSDILNRCFSAGKGHDESLPVHISDVTGTSARPDLVFIRQSALAGCGLCSEMLRTHFTKICNAFRITTRDTEAEEVFEAVSMKFPRISIDVVFEDGDEDVRFPHYLLAYTHAVAEDDTQNENDPSESNSLKAIVGSRFGRLIEEEPEDTDVFLQTLFEIIRSDCKLQSLISLVNLVSHA